MNEKPKQFPLAVVLAGVVAVLVIVVGVILIVRMHRHGPEIAGTEHGPKESAEDTSRTAVDTHGEDRAPQPETGETVTEAPTEPTAAQGEAAEETAYWISGRTVDLEGRGVAGAVVQVRLRPAGEHPVARETTTDDAGAFKIDGLPRNDLFVAASHGERRFYAPSASAENQKAWCLLVPYVAGRNHVSDIVLTLRPSASIAGRVVDTHDQPVTKAVLTVHDIGASAETDEEGRFRITGLIPGRCWFHARAEGYLGIDYVPAATGDDDILVVLERGIFVQGNVIFAEDRTPAPGARIHAQAKLGKDTRGVGDATADANGHFEILAHPQAPTVFKARLEGYVSDPEQPVEVTPDTGHVPVTIELIEGGSIAGLVRDKDTELPVAGVGIGVRAPGGEWLGAESDEQGTFTLKALVPGPHVVSLYPFQPFGNTADEEEITVDVAPGEAPAKVEFWVRRKLTITGTVVNAEGEPVFGAAITKRSESEGGGATCFTDRTVSDADGRFVIRQTDSRWAITGLLVCHPDYCHVLAEITPDPDAGNTRDVRIVLEQGGGSISGCVTNADGTPAPSAQLVLFTLDAARGGSSHPPDVAAVLTAEDGRYAFDPVSPGKYRVRATAYGQAFDSGDLRLEAGQKLDDVNLTIAASGHIAGRVTNTDGEPVPGMKIEASSRQTHRYSSTQTDADGRYRFDSLAEGQTYGLSVRAESKGYKRYVYRTVTCPADNEDFVLVPVEGCTVRGFVYARADARPVPQFKITVSSKTRRGTNASISTTPYDFVTPDGSFECVGVPPGELFLVIEAPDFAQYTGEPFTVEAGAEATQVVYLDAGGTVRGTVYRKSNGSPVTKYTLALLPQDETNARGMLARSWEPETVESDDGSFKRANVNAGTYTIMVVADGLPAHTTEPFEVEANSETVQNILLSEGGTVRGTVVDESGRPIADATVGVVWNVGMKIGSSTVFRSDMNRPHGPPGATTDSAGRFELHGLPPGKLALRATHPEYVESGVRNIEVTDEAPTEGVVVTLKKGTVLYGWVKDFEGKPVRDGTVRFSGPQFCKADIDKNGEYRSPRLGPGEYLVSLDPFDAKLPEITLDGKADRELNIDLRQAGTISGEVLLPSGSEDVVMQIHLITCGRMRSMQSTHVASDKRFELKNLFEGKYELRVTARSTSDRDKTFEVTTSPEEIIVTVGPNEDVEYDISIVSLKEPEPRQ